MSIIVKHVPQDVQRAWTWWHNLEIQWKMAYNEAVFGKDPTMEPPKEDELMLFALGVKNLRFAGPLAPNPNMTTQVDNLSGLRKITKINFLSISHTNITSLHELRKHVNLEHLFVYNNKLTSLKGIENMKKLKELYFQCNEITDLKPLKGLKKLETIYASDNKLTSFDGITEKHADTIKKLHILPNEGLKDRDIIKFQNTMGIICHKG